MRALRQAEAALPAFCRRSRSRGQGRASEPTSSGSRRQSRGGATSPAFPVPRLRAGRWLAGACLLVGLTVGMSDSAFATSYWLDCFQGTTVNEGDSLTVKGWCESGELHRNSCSFRFWTQAGSAGTSDYVDVNDQRSSSLTSERSSIEYTFYTTQDDLDEGDEKFLVRVTGDAPTHGQRSGYCAITIKDDDLKYTGTPTPRASGALVSNVTQTSGAQLSFDHDVAQAFRTGSNAAGYTLTGIDLALRGGSGTPAYAVSIRSDSAGRPGNSLGTLTNPALQSGDHNAEFTVPGTINLAANTWYWVVVDVSTGDSTSLIWGTDSNHQDAGWATSWEWRIANNGLSRGAGSTAWQSRTGKMKIAVHGSPRTAPVQTGTRGLVSNTGRSSDTTGSFDTDYAQAFTTGSNAAGYRLTAADLDITVAQPTGVLSAPAAYAVHIYSDASNSPGISLGSLRKPSRLSTGLNAFWPSFGGIDLKPGTTYWMVLDVSSAGNRRPQVALTDADAEDPGAATGWSIADSARSRTATGWTALTGNRALRIAIHADAKPPPRRRPAPGGW